MTGQGKYRKKENTPSNAEILENSHLEALRGWPKRQNLLEHTDLLSKQKMTRGGQDNKYRKLRGIAEYSRRNLEAKGALRSELTNGDADGSVRKGLGQEEDGDYP